MATWKLLSKYPDAEALKEHFGNDDYTDEVLDLMQELVVNLIANNLCIESKMFQLDMNRLRKYFSKIVRNYSK